MNTQFPSEAPFLSWKALARPHHERSKRWYITAGIIVAAFLIYSFITQAWTFSLVILLGGFVYWYLHKTEPQTHFIALWNQGIGYNDDFVPWDFCSGFWFWKGPHYTELHIESKKGLQQEIVIQTGTVSVANIRAILAEHLPEEHDRTEHVLDTISRICKI